MRESKEKIKTMAAKGYWLKQAKIENTDQFIEYVKTVVPWLRSVGGTIIAKENILPRIPIPTSRSKLPNRTSNTIRINKTISTASPKNQNSFLRALPENVAYFCVTHSSAKYIFHSSRLFIFQVIYGIGPYF